MANSISAMLGRKPFRAINLTNNTPVMTGLNVVGVFFDFKSTLMVNRDELGRAIVDARIIMPTTMVVKILADSIDSINEINQILLDTESIYSIMSRGIYVRNFVLSEENISQVPEMLSANPVELKFTQLMIGGDNKNICAQEGDAAKVFKGIVTPAQVAADQVAQLVDKVERISSEVLQ